MNTPLESKRLNHALAQTVNPTSRISMEGVQWAMDLFGIKPFRYDRGDSVEWHRHEEGHFEIVLSGRIQFCSEQTELILEPFQVLFIPPGTTHRWKCLEAGVMTSMAAELGRDVAMGPVQAALVEALGDTLGRRFRPAGPTPP